MRVVGEWLLVFVMAASGMGWGPANDTPAMALAQPEARGLQQGSAMQLTGPTACPSGGCAAGQRMGMRYDFDLGSATFDSGAAPNVLVCLYAPTKWGSEPATVVSTSEGAQKPYDFPPNGKRCADAQAVPSNYSLLAERVTTFDAATKSDKLAFSFRLGDETAGAAVTGGSGTVLGRVFTWSGGAWAAAANGSVDSAQITMGSANLVSPVYVANDSAACGANTPCYINSAGDDRTTADVGVGTGLKDAVDAINARGTIIILGSYTIKSSRVLVNKAVFIEGFSDSRVTFTGTANADTCSHGMLALEERVMVRNLNIDDGTCTNPNRNLVEISSRTGLNGVEDIVLIEYSDLTGGKDAIYVRPENTDPVVVRFNQISDNSGSALFYQTAGNSSELEATANNITNNGFNPQVNCGANTSGVIEERVANHNYWGPSIPSQDTSHCVITQGKRLGAAIARDDGRPGVRGRLETVTTTRTSPDGFDNQVAFYRSGDGSDFPLYIVDHGYMAEGGPPFTGALFGSELSPCSNYWDLFLPNGVAETVADNLELFFKYSDRDGEIPGCSTVINSSSFCDQSNTPGDYPLYWYDPSSAKVTNGWDPVGARPENLTTGEGQDTRCNITNREIQVTIDNNGRPSLNDDLSYAPFVIGIPVIKSFNLFTTSQTVRVEWATNLEPDVDGFNILRGTNPNNLSAINTTRINHSGSSTTGFTYNINDNGLVNGTKYYYRLEVVRKDGRKIYSERKDVTVNAPTALPPPPTRTLPPIRPTSTQTRTTVPTQRPTRMGGSTPTPEVTGSVMPTGLDLPTLTAEGEETGLPEDGTQQPAGTEIAMVETATLAPSRTVTPTRLVAQSGANLDSGPKRWGSLLLGLLAGLAMLGALGSWWYYSARK